MHPALVLAALMLATVPVRAAGTFQYGSRAGMEVDVVSMSGLDSSHAVMATRHTRKNAISYCREYVQRVTQDCISSELAVRLNDQVSANCISDTFTDFYGKSYRFMGPLKRADDHQIAHFGIEDVATGEMADGSNSSGYIINMLIFKALCPSKAPDESEF